MLMRQDCPVKLSVTSSVLALPALVTGPQFKMGEPVCHLISVLLFISFSQPESLFLYIIAVIGDT